MIQEKIGHKNALRTSLKTIQVTQSINRIKP